MTYMLFGDPSGSVAGFSFLNAMLRGTRMIDHTMSMPIAASQRAPFAEVGVSIHGFGRWRRSTILC